MTGLKPDAADALRRLKACRNRISSQQYRTIKGQIIAGDICGAEKGLRRLSPAIHFKEVDNHEIHGKHQ